MSLRDAARLSALEAKVKALEEILQGFLLAKAEQKPEDAAKRGRPPKEGTLHLNG